ncbi:MAG TPA: NAD(P)/FAD-dependent oxidoreductase [Candidatus Omnitrophota bacterium]|nr:NAD(P)/FAD-dependent oxidoreductase [Candidatus Omnitrophota bacterium]HQO58596.1 NAD(P)/FAD-dependent oxidoreductase [Candidatus Omnitrophota bacterium]HQP11913.1 NAD(P)/FAD-dependent oxidoreductase [Candidatus Omnitrophota bacterium]
MKTYDIIIIGGGVVGTAIARELSRYRLNIALLEKEEELAFGVSKSNSGIIHPGTQMSPRSLKGKLCVEGNRLIRRIARELGVDFKEVGELIVAFREEEVPQLLDLKEKAGLLGVPKLKIVRPAWLRKYEPHLSREAVAALYAPTAGILSPYRLVYDMAENAAKNGVEIYTRHQVTRITPSGNAGLGGKPFFEVATPTQTFQARYVINAGGLFADEVSALAGVHDFKIRPRKGEEFILDKKKEHLTRHLLFPLPSKTSKGILVIKTADGNPMIGPTAEDGDDREDVATSDEGLRQVLAGVQRMIPSMSADDIIAYFAGLRPVAGDDFIIRHEARVPGFVNVAGIQSPGLTAAPAIALWVLRILKETGLPLKKKSVFHNKRPKTIHLFGIPLSETEKLVKKDPALGDIVCRCEMVSFKEIQGAIERGATTLDGIKFRTRAQAGRCHGGFCTTRILKILADAQGVPLTRVTKKGAGSEIVKEERGHD